MKPLIAKELRAQLPFAMLTLIFAGLEVLSQLMRALPFSLGESVHDLLSSDFEPFYVLSFAIGTGLLVREEDDGTLSFLDGLPTTRERMFLAKVAVAGFNVALYPIAMLPFMLAFHAARFTSQSEWNLELVAIAVVLFCFANCVALGLGLALGYLRRLAWAAFGMLVTLFLALRDTRPWLDVLSPRALLAEQFAGHRWIIPGTPLLAQGILLVVCLLFGYLRFSGRLQLRSRRLIAFGTRPVFSVMVMVVTVAALVAVALRFSRSRSEETSHYAQPPDASTRTAHYVFTYPGDRTKAALSLIKRADPLYEAVAKELGVELFAEPIEVDGSGSARNTSGTTFSTKIRIELLSAHADATLVHETTHVFAQRLAHFERPGRLRNMIAFNEGLARRVERRVVPEGDGAKQEPELAALQSRHQAAVAPVMEPEQFFRTFDENLKYPLGALFINELVERYGQNAPARVLRTLGEGTFPPNLSGYALWHTALHLAGYDLPLVLADCERRTLEALKHHRAEVDALPRLRAQLISLEDQYLGLRLYGDRPFQNFGLVARVRPDEESPISEYRTYSAQTNHVVWLDRKRVRRQRVCFQSGIVWEGVILYEPWDCVALKSADPVTRAELDEGEAASDSSTPTACFPVASNPWDAGTGTLR